MVGYDVPDVAHDMILRFMGVDFSKIAEGSARIPSAVGDDRKVTWVEGTAAQGAKDAVSTKTPEQDKAMWEGEYCYSWSSWYRLIWVLLAYYNAGSAAIVLVLVLVAIAGILYCRVRRRRGLKLPVSLPMSGQDAEESIPLRGRGENGHAEDGDEFRQRGGKGKERELPEQEAIFEVGDSDDEEARTPGR